MNVIKTLKVFFIVVVVFVVIAVTATVIILKNLDVQSYKKTIVTQLENSLHRSVTLDHLDFHFSLFKGVALTMDGFSIAEDPAFSSSAMIKVDQLNLYADILAFLTERQFAISKIEVVSPKVNLIRNKEGEWNVLAMMSSKENVLRQADQNKTKGDKGPQKKISPPPVLIKSIRVTHGELLLVDGMMTPSIQVPFKNLALDVINFSFNKPFLYRMKCSLWSQTRNVQLKGQAQAQLEQKEVRLDDMQLSVDLAPVSLGDLIRSVPVLNHLGLEKNLQGIFKARVNQLVMGEKGLLVASLDAHVEKGSVILKSLASPLDNINIDIEANERDMRFKRCDVDIAAGHLSGEGRMADYMKEQNFDLNFNLTDLKLDKLIPSRAMPVKLQGALWGELKAVGNGFTEDQLKNSLSGDGHFEVRGGKIVDVNFLRILLSKISVIPNLSERFEASLPEAYQEKLKAKDTVFSKVDITTKIEKDSFIIQQAEVEADGFSLAAKGKVNMEHDLNLKADFYISEDLSVSMIHAVAELAYLMDEEKRIAIPFKSYEGKMEKLIMYPDLEYIASRVIKSKGKEELKNVIFRALKIENNPSSQDNSQDSPTSEEKNSGSGEKAIIENVLDSIFK